MDIARIIQIYIVQGLIGLFYFYTAIKILKRDHKNLHLILGSFYSSVGVGLFINIIYASIFDERIVYLLHFITIYILCFGLVFLLIFVLILKKSINIINVKKQLVLIFLYGIALLGLWFIPNGIKIDESTNWKPVWSFELVMYSFFISTFFIIIPIIYYSISIYLKLENKELKQKWLFFLIGVISYFFLYYGTSISNMLNDPPFRFIWSILSLITIPFSFLIYFGLGRELP